MNPRTWATRKSVKAPMRLEKWTMEMRGSEAVAAKKATITRKGSNKERQKALLQDVDMLKKKLRHEENVNRALKRAFTRPLGALPRLPPYLPPHILLLLAEVAVLEEEVVRLEDKVVQFREGLYQEAVHVSSSKQNMDNQVYQCNPFSKDNPNPKQEQSRTETEGNAMAGTLLPLPVDGQGKKKQLCGNSARNNKQALNHRGQSTRTTTKRRLNETALAEKPKECRGVARKNTVATRTAATLDVRLAGDDGPNKISEDILKCLMGIFVRMSTLKSRCTAEVLPSLSALSKKHPEGEFRDPYGICSTFGKIDIGPYKHLLSIEANSLNLNRRSNSLFLVNRLKLLLGKLELVDLKGLTHHEKLAFWINIYNSCMMNAFLEHGIPGSPEMVVALMQKATINVGGHLLNAIFIEHFILRLPYHLKYTFPKSSKSDEMEVRSIFGLESSEPLVTFALCCGSWSSPVVRVYTALQVEKELEVAKREYLQAAVVISTKLFAIPKLLDWYLLDFAKDLESLLDWICVQFPDGLRKEAMECLGRGKRQPLSRLIQFMPYKFSFRYLI